MTRYFLFDCETGGTPEQGATLLSLYGEVLDEKLNVLDSIDLFVKPDDGVYAVHPAAMDCNKIDLQAHHETATGMRQARLEFTKFLLKNKDRDAEWGRRRFIPVGHQVEFDVHYAKLLYDKEQAGQPFEDMFTRYVIDTRSLAEVAQMSGKLPKDLTLKLGGLAKHFKMSYDGAHNAEFDTKLTLAILKELLKL